MLRKEESLGGGSFNAQAGSGHPGLGCYIVWKLAESLYSIAAWSVRIASVSHVAALVAQPAAWAGADDVACC